MDFTPKMHTYVIEEPGDIRYPVFLFYLGRGGRKMNAQHDQPDQHERLEQLFATWHHLVQSQGAGHDVHRELDVVIGEVFKEIGINITRK